MAHYLHVKTNSVSRLGATETLTARSIKMLNLQSVCLWCLFKDSLSRDDAIRAHHAALQMLLIGETINDIHCLVRAYTSMLQLLHRSGDINGACEYEVGMN